MMQALHGSLVALVTPMNSKGDIDFNSLEKLIEWHKGIAEEVMKFMGWDHYNLLWYSWIEGFIVGGLVVWLLF